MSTNLLVLFDEAMLEHDAGPGHPERPDRLRAVCDELRRAPPADLTWSRPKPADRASIERIHDPAYIDRLEGVRGRSAALDVDTAVSPGSLPAAYLAAGAALEAVSALMSGVSRRVLALVRPPGHHAEAGRAMGFCLFNNIAVAAAHARAELGSKRVLIVDWDVHHGNGTQSAFFSRRDVLFFSTHRFPFYPGTGDLNEVGEGEGAGFTVNVPLPGGFGDGEYAAIFDEVLVPIADAFGPDLVLVSAGFDAHARDPLGGMGISETGFASLCATVCGLADRHAEGRLALVLEGGYDLSALAGSVRACAGILGGSVPPPTTRGPHAAGEIIESVRSVQRRFWPLPAG